MAPSGPVHVHPCLQYATFLRATENRSAAQAGHTGVTGVNPGWLAGWLQQLRHTKNLQTLKYIFDSRPVHRYTATVSVLNPLTPNDNYSGRTALLTSKRCILYIYSTYIGTEYFKRGIYSPSFSLQNAVCFVILTYLVPVLFTFYTQVC